MAKEKESGFEEMIYTIPLRREWLKVPRKKRANRTVNVVKEFLSKHMKASEVNISPKLNEFFWKKGISNPPGSVKVKVSRDKGTVTARLPDELVLDKKADKKGGKGMLGGLKEKAKGIKEGLGTAEDTPVEKPAEGKDSEAVKPEEMVDEKPKEEPEKKPEEQPKETPKDGKETVAEKEKPKKEETNTRA